MKSESCNVENQLGGFFDFDLRSGLLSGEESSDSECSLTSTEDESHLPCEESSRNLSCVLSKVDIPENPLSQIGELTEKRLLKLSGALHTSEITHLDLSGCGLSKFGSNSRLNLSKLKNLTSLNLSSNYITDLEGVLECPTIQYLDISSNLIRDISVLYKLPELSTLKADYNQIHQLSQIKSCKSIKVLLLSNNKLLNFRDTLQTLKSLSKLETLAIDKNPCIHNTKKSKSTIIAECPELLELDGSQITNSERNQACSSLLKDSRSFVPRLTKSESVNPVPAESELETQLYQLKKDNSKLKEELKRAWDLLEQVSGTQQ